MKFSNVDQLTLKYLAILVLFIPPLRNLLISSSLPSSFDLPIVPLGLPSSLPYKDEKVWSADSGVQWSPEREWNSDCSRAGNQKGRFPANLLVSDDVLDDGKEHGSPKQYKKRHAGFRSDYVGGDEISPTLQSKEYGDTGGFSRFFSLDAWSERNLPFLIVPKASKKEKNVGMDESRKDKNVHPTVKPIKLMTYLITMGSRCSA
jgi:hypothetical protein